VTANFISGPELQIYLQLTRSSGEQARGEFSRELASRSLSPIRPLPATCEPHFRNTSSFRAGGRQVQRLQFLFSGPWKPAQGKGKNAQGRESRYCEKFYRQQRGFAQSLQENLTKIESHTLRKLKAVMVLIFSRLRRFRCEVR
jgi:hypothetical protein